MHQESRRMKSTIFWLWMFKSFQRCWAGRSWADNVPTSRLLWSAANSHRGDGSYTRLGRFSLSEEKIASSSHSRNAGTEMTSKIWGKHSNNAASPQSLHTAARFVPPVLAASLARSSVQTTQNEPLLHHEDETIAEYNYDHDEEYDDYYFDENDDNIFYLQEDVVAVRKNPTRHGALTSSGSVHEVVPASVKLRIPKRKQSQQKPAVAVDEQETDNIIALTQPIVPISVSLEDETGEMFANPANMDRLVESGLDMARLETNEFIDWKMDSSSKKLLKDKTEREVLEQADVLVYVGTAKNEGHGSHLPIIKTKSILPISAHGMADLLMDSSRVKIYNKMSLGRTDVRTFETDSNQQSKIVCNLTKPPIAKSSMISCTLMHSRKLSQTETQPPRDTYLVVSRAVPGMIADAQKDLPRNDILLGVNLLEDIDGNQCVMTAVTHVYSPALPTMLAKSMGVSSAINFVKDIRKSCEETAAAAKATNSR